MTRGQASCYVGRVYVTLYRPLLQCLGVFETASIPRQAVKTTVHTERPSEFTECKSPFLKCSVSPQTPVDAWIIWLTTNTIKDIPF